MEFSEFILAHDSDDVAALALQRGRLSAQVQDWDLALSTLQARRKLKAKLPSWYAVPSLHYPLPLSAEQCSSEETALYKASLLIELVGARGFMRSPERPEEAGSEGLIGWEPQGDIRGAEPPANRRGRHSFRNTTPTPAAMSLKMAQNKDTEPKNCSTSLKMAKIEDGIYIADLTGGLGVDAWAFSKVAEKVLYNEMKPELVEAAEHNFKELGVSNLVIRSNVVEKGKVKAILDGFEPDVIFLDPARRDDVGRKVFMLEDCSPNVLELLPELYEACPRIMLKLSPMADITAVCRQLPGVREVHVVEADGECKELLLILEKGYEGPYKLYLFANASVAEITGTEPYNDDGWSNDRIQSNGYYMVRSDGNDGSEVQISILFVPGKGLMKTGAFWWPERFGMKQLAASTHMYIGTAKVPELEPFGKFYTILESVPLSNKSIKEFGKKYPVADVTARNIPMTSDELRKRLGVRPSDGTVHIFGTSASDGRTLIVGVICK